LYPIALSSIDFSNKPFRTVTNIGTGTLMNNPISPIELMNYASQKFRKPNNHHFASAILYLMRNTRGRRKGRRRSDPITGFVFLNGHAK
jgi:hypothetical protein